MKKKPKRQSRPRTKVLLSVLMLVAVKFPGAFHLLHGVHSPFIMEVPGAFSFVTQHSFTFIRDEISALQHVIKFLRD